MHRYVLTLSKAEEEEARPSYKSGTPTNSSDSLHSLHSPLNSSSNLRKASTLPLSPGSGTGTKPGPGRTSPSHKSPSPLTTKKDIDGGPSRGPIYVGEDRYGGVQDMRRARSLENKAIAAQVPNPYTPRP
jgi:hypothetical protein